MTNEEWDELFNPPKQKQLELNDVNDSFSIYNDLFFPQKTKQIDQNHISETLSVEDRLQPIRDRLRIICE